MAKFLFIESRDPFESKDTVQTLGLVKELRAKGHDVILYLIQNGVFCSRKNVQVGLFTEILNDGQVPVYADGCSLNERGILGHQIPEEIRVSDEHELVDLLMEDGRKPVWH